MSRFIQTFRDAIHKKNGSQTDSLPQPGQKASAAPNNDPIGTLPIGNPKPEKTIHIASNPNASLSNVSTKSSPGGGSAVTSNAYKNGTVYRPPQHQNSKSKSVTQLSSQAQNDTSQSHASPQQPKPPAAEEHKDASEQNQAASVGATLSPPATDNAPLLTPVQEHHAEHHEEENNTISGVRSDAATESESKAQGTDSQAQGSAMSEAPQKQADSPNDTCACGAPTPEKVDVACQTDGGEFEIDRYDAVLHEQPVAERPL
jgi:hypothetical protein